MKWLDLKKYRKFTPVKDIIEEIGSPKFKLNDLPIYYWGSGYLLAYSEKKFKIENKKRVEYGKVGEYYIRLYYFHNQAQLKDHFRIGEDDRFEKNLGENFFEIVEGITIGAPYAEVVANLKSKREGIYYAEGESRLMNKNRVFVHQHDWIAWGEYQFYFYPESGKKILNAFEYNVR